MEAHGRIIQRILSPFHISTKPIVENELAINDVHCFVDDLIGRAQVFLRLSWFWAIGSARDHHIAVIVLRPFVVIFVYAEKLQIQYLNFEIIIAVR